MRDLLVIVRSRDKKLYDNTIVSNNHSDVSHVITLDEEGLMHVLKGEDFEECHKKPMKFNFRF